EYFGCLLLFQQHFGRDSSTYFTRHKVIRSPVHSPLQTVGFRGLVINSEGCWLRWIPARFSAIPAACSPWFRPRNRYSGTYSFLKLFISRPTLFKP
ncbi:hypothetical protein QML37_31385, partial [Klebsiella pneumoniae]|uniref:hypothetical protein n=1 Tax=Klebsiella pneumoniae TaxID=573 RepID=UPI003A7FD396